jgi:hypothetical protein
MPVEVEIMMVAHDIFLTRIFVLLFLYIDGLLMLSNTSDGI